MVIKGNEIIDIPKLKNDTVIIDLIKDIMSRLLNIKLVDTFIEKLDKARFIFIKRLTSNNLSLYKTNEIDIGYTDKLTLDELHMLIATNKVNEDIPIYLKYAHGNVFAYILAKDIDKKLLLREDIYILVHNTTKEIYDISIGKFGNPNRLYYRSELNNITTVFNKVRTLKGIQRFNIISQSEFN